MQTEGELLNFPFEEAEHQRESALFGMWIFLATEVLFFGGLFAAYTVYRFGHGQAFLEAGRHQEWYLGCLNTILLLTSGFSMALAVQFARLGRLGGLLVSFAVTWVLGAAFLAVEGYEYYDKFQQHLFPGPSFRFSGSDPAGSQLFFVLYFTMTGLHMLHMLIGLILIAFFGLWAARSLHAPAPPQSLRGPRALLGLRRHRLAFPLSALLSGQPEMKVHVIQFLRVLGALYLFLALTSILAFLPLGSGNLLLNVGIAFIMAGLIALFFMRVKYSEPLVRLTSVAGLVWLSLMLGLMFLDYLSRPWPR